jgi:FMN phosphatase YigB (HAD superfamily)
MTKLLERMYRALFQRAPRWLALSYFRLIGVRPYSCSYVLKARASCISFDAFETLLIRPVMWPRDVFLLCGRLLKSGGNIKLSAEQWSQLRIQGEEIKLADIYRCIERSISDPCFDPKSAMAVELSTERRLLKPVWETFSTLQRVSKDRDTIVVSDTYFDQKDLETFLEDTGAMPASTRVIASSQTGLTKHSGSLYKNLLKEGDPAPSGLLHIGDNFYSDVHQARNAGHRPAPYTGSSLAWYEKILSNADVSPYFLRSAIVGSARSARLRTKYATLHERDLAEVSAGVTAPLLLAYVSWILRRAQELNLTRLYFLARDGEILLSLAQQLISTYDLNIEARYLYVSRRSLHLPALDQLSNEDVKSLGIEAGLTFLDVLRKVGFDELANPAEFLRSHGYNSYIDDTSLSAVEIQHLLSILRKEPLLSELARISYEARSTLISYLEQEQFFDPGKVGIVDIGWKGRLQRSICLAAQHEGLDITARLHGFYLGLYDYPAASGSFEVFLDDHKAKNLKPFVRGSLFEVFCAASHGTTLAYRSELGNRFVPVLAVDRNEEAISWGIYTQQDSVNNFSRDLLLTIETYGVTLNELENALVLCASTVVRSLISRPRKKDADALGSFPHSADQNHKLFTDIAPPILSKPLHFFVRMLRRGNTPVFTYWREGSLARSFPSVLSRMLIWLNSSSSSSSQKA